MKGRGGVIFALILFVIFAGGFSLCMQWSAKARLFPLLIVSVGIVLSGWLVISEVLHSRAPARTTDKSRVDSQKAALKTPKQKITPRSEITMILWVAGFLVLILLFGFWIAIAAFTPLFMPLFGRENWKMAAIFTVCIWFGIYLVFGVAMKVSLYGGIFGIAW